MKTEGGGERLAKEKPVNFTGVYLDYQHVEMKVYKLMAFHAAN